jgi:UDP-sulfoquinovose synthase
MVILILGADGYLGWPTTMYLASKGHEVIAVDNFAKRQWELENGITPLFPIATMHRRVDVFKEVTGKEVILRVGDLLNHRFVYKLFDELKPDIVIHYAEQPSGPYSMRDRATAFHTQNNNVLGTLNVLFAMHNIHNDCHLIKLGTMGEYGTPNIDIEEGYIEIEHKGRKDTLPFPAQPPSFYHLSKVHDSNNIRFATRIWGLKTTNLNQGVVYGVETDETKLHTELETSFHYDELFGTALNRFCVQAVSGHPMTPYGKGDQKRGFLNIVDTLKCVELAALNQPEPGFMRVFNQFTEVFSINELTHTIKDSASLCGIEAEISHVDNPRIEMEDHHYNPVHTKLTDIGLKPLLLRKTLIESMLKKISEYKNRINRKLFIMNVKWKKS